MLVTRPVKSDSLDMKLSIKPFLQKKLQITRRKLSNNTQRCEHQLQAHNAANETYKNSQVIKTQTRYTQGTVWQEFCSSDSDNIGNNDSDNSI